MSNSKINIYYSADNRLYQQLLISLISLTENNKDNELHIYNFDVEIIEYNTNSKKLSIDQLNTINSLVTKYNKKNSFTEIDVSDLIKKHLLISDSPNINKKNNWYKNNAFLYIRTLLPYVKNMPSKLL
jgi:lipopolysaccharide biosynthesis glycosyltransferase